MLLQVQTFTGIEADPDRSNGTKRIRARAGRPFEGEDADLSKELDEANRVILDNPDLIKVGQKLKIPE